VNAQPPPANGPIDRRFWILASLVYATLIYSTSLHLTIGTERTVDLSYYTREAPAPVAGLASDFPDIGRWRGSEETATRWRDQALRDAFPPDIWKLSSAWPDAAYYLLQTESPERSIPPYRYRVLPPSLVGIISRVLGAWPGPVFAIVNALFTLATAVLFTAYLRAIIGLTPLLCMTGGVLFVTLLSNTSSVGFPLLEPASMFFMMLVVMALARRRVWMFCLASVLGVMTKEVLLVAAPLWFLNTVDVRSRSGRQWAFSLLPSVVPVLAFVALRRFLGGGALEVNYGYDITAGQFPVQYVARLADPVSLLVLLAEIFTAFGFLWLGVVNLRRHPFLWRNAIVIVLVVGATAILSGRMIRPLGIVFPILIPGFLLFFTSLTPEERIR
jgi:hypothetical protein